MIPYYVFPMFHVGPIRFNFYGIMFAAGFIVASYLARRIAERRELRVEYVEELVMYIMLSGITAARIFYLLFYWPEGRPFEFLDIFKIWEGGLAFYGGFIGAILAGIAYCRKKAISFWQYADVFTIPLIVGHIFGRIGDYLTGGHPGKVSDLPWAIYLQGAPRHPVVLYEIIGLILILVIVRGLSNRNKIDGLIFLGYIMLYALQRFILDYFRIESTDPRTFGLTPTQILVVLLFSGTLIISGILVKKATVSRPMSDT